MRDSVLCSVGVLLTAVLVWTNAALARESKDECPAPNVEWTPEVVQECIGRLDKRIKKAAPGSATKVALLARRAQLYESLGYDKEREGLRSTAELEAALADYSAAIAISPKDDSLLHKRAQLFMRMGRGEDALTDAETLLSRNPNRVPYQAAKGDALVTLKRHDEAIQVYEHAILLTQFCAEASRIQKQLNEYRRAFDPPMTKAQAWKAMEEMRQHPLNAVPEPLVTQLGFPCAPTASNGLDELVSWKSSLYQRRGDVYRQQGKQGEALRDFEYAVAISTIPEFGSINLCMMHIEMKLDFNAVESCRHVFDFNAHPILSDADQAARIGQLLLDDGDLKGACRIAFPFAGGSKVYLDSPNIKALQTRVKTTMTAAGMTACEREFRLPTPS